MADFEVFQIEIAKNYTFNEWREDLRKMLRKTGEEGVSMVFLFGDHQIKVLFITVDKNCIYIYINDSSFTLRGMHILYVTSEYRKKYTKKKV